MSLLNKKVDVNNLPNGYFSPEMFSKKLWVPFYASAVAPFITTGQYFDDLKHGHGDTIHVIKRPAVKLTDGVIGGARKITDLKDERVSFSLDYLKECSVVIDTVEKNRQIIDSMKDVEFEIGYQMSQAVDKDVLVGSALNAGLEHDCQTTWASDGSAPKDIVMARALLKKNNVPTKDLFLVLDEVAAGYLLLEKQLWADISGKSSSAFMTGEIGTILGGIKVFTSNNLGYDNTGAGSNGNQMHGLFGHKSAIAMAVVIQKFDHFDKLESMAHAQMVSGHIVYGTGVVHPEALVRFKPLTA